MPLTKEEIEQIAEATAERIVAKAKGNPYKEPMYSQCRCGLGATHMISSLYHTLEDFREFKKLTDMHHAALGVQFRLLQADCPADMAKVDDIIKRVKQTGTISEKDVDEALDVMFQGFLDCTREAAKEK